MFGLLLLMAVPSVSPVLPPSSDAMIAGGFKDGDEIYRSCQPEQSLTQQAICAGYIQGLSDELEVIQSYLPNGKIYCAPAYVSVGEVKDAIVTYLADSPADRAKAAATLGTLALARAFPCAK